MIILADPVYNPENQTTINSATKLGSGITIAKFLGAYGDRTPFNHIESLSTRKRIARNLYPHAEAMKMINESPLFEDIRLIISEGIFQPKNFIWTGGVIDEKRFGRLVYYQVIDKEGNIDFEKTFDIAEYWKDYIEFDTLYLDYDSYNPDGSLTAQIGLKFPEIPSTFDVTMKNNIETWYNNNLMSKNELIEIRETE